MHQDAPDEDAAGDGTDPGEPVPDGGDAAGRGPRFGPAGTDAATAPGTPVGNDAGSDQHAGNAAADPGSGLVSLVGAGPGDPDLLTRRAWKRIEAADVVLHDSLTGDDVVGAVPGQVDVVDVGKRPPDRTSQAEINAMMADRAGAGERVVRLKGGDPTVFGRGGEEAEHLAGAGVPFEIVPGVSSVLAAPSVSGIPLTHRDRASSVTVVTGHETPDKDESALDWAALADTVSAGGTLVVLMGVRRLPENVRALRDHGVPAETPVSLVQKATWDDERTVVGTLETIVERADAVDPPAVTIVGDVVEVRDAVADLLVE